MRIKYFKFFPYKTAPALKYILLSKQKAFLKEFSLV